MPRPFAALLVAALTAACAQSVTSTAATADAGPAVDVSAAVDVPAAVDAPVAVDVPAVIDSALSDDCRRGTWCWERPVPTGEVAVAAVTPSADRVVFITEGGTLAAWDGARWSTRLLTLPGRPTGLYVGPDGEVVVAVVEPISQREHWIVELRGGAQRVVPLPGDGYITQLRASGDALWALGARELFRRRAGEWERIGGPAGGPVLAGVHVVGPDEVIALESWGSGSGTGLLHRYAAGAWELVVDFRDLAYRVEGPLVRHDGALWMRAYDNGTRESFALRVDGADVQVLGVPRGLGSINLYGVGDALWLVDGVRAWSRQGDDWTPVAGFPGRAYGVIAGFGADVAWVFTDGVHRLRGGAWERLGEGDHPTGHFWDTAGLPSLLSLRPAGFLAPDGAARPAWTLRPLDLGGDALDDSPPVDGVGYVATSAGAHPLRGGVAGAMIPWPEPRRFGVAFGGSAAGLWAWAGTDRLAGYTAGAWSEVAGPAFDDAPRGSYTVDAVHFTADARLFVAATVLTGDKQVRRRVFVREGAAWRQIVAEMGVFGRTEGAFVAGDRADAVYVGLAGLYRYDGATATLLAPGLDVQALARRSDDVAVVLTPTGVETWSARGARLDRYELPPVRASFSRVHQGAAGGAVRVANASGQVLRYTP